MRSTVVILLLREATTFSEGYISFETVACFANQFVAYICTSRFDVLFDSMSAFLDRYLCLPSTDAGCECIDKIFLFRGKIN